MDSKVESHRARRPWHKFSTASNDAAGAAGVPLRDGTDAKNSRTISPCRGTASAGPGKADAKSPTENRRPDDDDEPPPPTSAIRLGRKAADEGEGIAARRAERERALRTGTAGSGTAGAAGAAGPLVPLGPLLAPLR